MIKTGKYKTQARTVVHEGKVYKGTMPNLNMKTDLTESFEYIATIVEGMSSGCMNGNQVFEDFKQSIIENTIKGEVGKLIHERGHTPENYEPSAHLGRYSSQVAIARGPSNLDVSSIPQPTKSLPKEVGKATDLVVKKIKELKKEDVAFKPSIETLEHLEQAEIIDIGANLPRDNHNAMEELMRLFDAWEKVHPFAKRNNETAEKRLERIEKELKEIGLKAVTRVKDEKEKISGRKYRAVKGSASERIKKLAENIAYSEKHVPGKKVVKKGKKSTVAKKVAKKKVTKKTTKKKVTKKKVAKKKDTK